jgi:hypothetical protein
VFFISIYRLGPATYLQHSLDRERLLILLSDSFLDSLGLLGCFLARSSQFLNREPAALKRAAGTRLIT